MHASPETADLLTPMGCIYMYLWAWDGVRGVGGGGVTLSCSRGRSEGGRHSHVERASRGKH